jgi:hypothetical protein
VNPEDIVKTELVEYISKGQIEEALTRILQVIDPDMLNTYTIIKMVRKHGHGQVVVNIGKGKINAVNQTLSFLV